MIKKENSLQDKILEAAMVLIRRYGLNKITMDDVARQVGKSRSSLYYYFKNREEIFDAVMNAFIEEISTEIKIAMDEAQGLENKLNAFFTTKLSTSRERTAFYRALEMGMNASELSQHKQAMADYHFKLMQREHSLLNQFFNDAISLGKLKPVDAGTIDQLILIALSSIRGINRELGYQNKAYQAPGELIQTLSNMMINSLQ